MKWGLSHLTHEETDLFAQNCTISVGSKTKLLGSMYTLLTTVLHLLSC